MVQESISLAFMRDDSDVLRFHRQEEILLNNFRHQFKAEGSKERRQHHFDLHHGHVLTDAVPLPESKGKAQLLQLHPLGGSIRPALRNKAVRVLQEE